MAQKEYHWLELARRLQSIAQAGLEYCHTDYDRDRYQQIREISTEIIEHYSDYSREDIIRFFASDDGYPTPKVDVRAAIFKDDKILMVREKSDGKWSLPGGWADQHLTLSENLIKESYEEAGVKVEPGKVIAILDRNKRNTPPIPHGCYKIFVHCDLKSGSFNENTETSDSAFYSLEELPELSTERNTSEQIEICFRSLKEKWKVLYD
jgi:ADP-ribose pyrophosphatase YjhB (NUDIX family)